MGDIVMASGMIASLRRAYPHASLVWLVQSGYETLLSTNPQLDAVIIWEKQVWQKLWRQKKFFALFKHFLQLRKQLTSYRFDIAIDTQGLLKSGILVWLSRARRRIGLGSREGSQWLMTETIRVNRQDPMLASEYRRLLQHLACETSRYIMHITVLEDDRQSAVRLMSETNIPTPFIALCPYTTRPQKHWFNANWIELADQIALIYGLPSVILGGPTDTSHALALCQRSKNLINLAGRTTLRQAFCILSKASAMIGVDTGLSHMGLAAGIPGILLFGSTRPYLLAPEYRSYILYKNLSCSPCRRRPTCGGAYTCMRDITVQDVFKSLQEILPKRHENTASGNG